MKTSSTGKIKYINRHYSDSFPKNENWELEKEIGSLEVRVMWCQQLRQVTWKLVPEDPDGTQQTQQAVDRGGCVKGIEVSSESALEDRR